MQRTTRWSRWLIAGAALMSLAVSSPALSQSSTNPFSFGVFGGASIPLGDLRDDDGVKTGFNLGGLIQVRQPMWPVALRLDGQFNRFKPKDETDDFNFDITSVSLDVVFMPSTSTSELKPYVLVGPSYFHSSVGSGGVSISANDWGFNGGVGVTYALSGFSTFAEARYNWIHTDDGSNSILPISVGIRIPQ